MNAWSSQVSDQNSPTPFCEHLFPQNYSVDPDQINNAPRVQFSRAWPVLWNTAGTHLQFRPFRLSEGLKDVCAVFCVCPCHMFLFDWLQRGESHQSGVVDWTVLIALLVASGWVIPTDCTSGLSGCNKQGLDRPADWVTRARLEESQQVADVCRPFFIFYYLFAWLHLINRLQN